MTIKNKSVFTHTFYLLPPERQQELFDEIVLGNKKEEVKSLRLFNDENNKKK